MQRSSNFELLSRMVKCFEKRESFSSKVFLHTVHVQQYSLANYIDDCFD